MPAGPPGYQQLPAQPQLRKMNNEDAEKENASGGSRSAQTNPNQPREETSRLTPTPTTSKDSVGNERR